MVSSDTIDNVLTGLSKQQSALLRAFTEDGTATTDALQRAFAGAQRPLTRSEQASLSRALRRLEQRGLVKRDRLGSAVLTPQGLDLVFPVRHKHEAERQARLAQLLADINRLDNILRHRAFRY